jgi:hypothetical protein
VTDVIPAQSLIYAFHDGIIFDTVSVLDACFRLMVNFCKNNEVMILADLEDYIRKCVSCVSKLYI